MTADVADTVRIRLQEWAVDTLPEGLVLDGAIGLVRHPTLQGQVVHVAQSQAGRVYESRGTRAPDGTYLLMFPDGAHYGHAGDKVNDMVAYMSRDGGQTWQGPRTAFDIEYNQHGFIPLQPSGSSRLYAFGTQPMWDLYTRTDGLHENAPIGYRYSDDSGLTWSGVRLIRPRNDPGFTGMSVMRMCETGRGTWLLGSHEGDWSYRPLLTRQYILRSEDQGHTWDLLPGRRHGGWHAMPLGRMDEGRPIAVDGDEVYLLARTPTGHLWDARSLDDGRTWSEPQPTSMIHPDAPPMLFPLSDGVTWVNLHHNVHSQSEYTGLEGSMEGMKDRGQLWASLSRDGGRTWSAPGFLCTMARRPVHDSHFCNYQCSYVDGFADPPWLHLFMSQSWERVLHLRIAEKELFRLPSAQELGV